MKKSSKKEDKMVKIVAEKNMKPVLDSWVTEIFGLNPTKEDYKEALSFVEDIIKNAKKEPNYLKLLGDLVLRLESSKFVDKLLPYIFRTVMPSNSKKEISNRVGLEFEHKLIMEELKDTREELWQLKEKSKD